MCNNCTNELEIKEYINYQTGEKLDLIRVSTLPDNAMLKVRTDLWCKWDFEKNSNLGLDIWKMTRVSEKTAWWVCNRKHSYDLTIRREVSGLHCPICLNYRILVGYNDMWTTNPELAKLLADPEDGYKYTYGSGKRVNWKCLDCGEIIKNKIIDNVRKQGLSCRACSDGTSFPERIMTNLLKTLNLSFTNDRKRDWSEGKRYDFYIQYYNTIIEVHGGQHYEETYGVFKNNRTREEEQANDQLKYGLAIQNGIKPENYIVIDCRYSELEFIKNNIMNSRLAELFDISKVDWDVIALNSEKSKHLLILEMCRNGYSKNQIIEESKYTYGTVQKIINKFIKLGMCEMPDIDIHY